MNRSEQRITKLEEVRKVKFRQSDDKGFNWTPNPHHPNIMAKRGAA